MWYPDSQVTVLYVQTEVFFRAEVVLNILFDQINVLEIELDIIITMMNVFCF